MLKLPFHALSVDDDGENVPNGAPPAVSVESRSARLAVTAIDLTNVSEDDPVDSIDDDDPLAYIDFDDETNQYFLDSENVPSHSHSGLQSISCHKPIRRVVHEAARDFLQILIDGHKVSNPCGIYFSDLKNLTKKRRAVYAKYDANGQLTKIGSTHEIRERYDDLGNVFVIVNVDSIPLDVEPNLVKRLNQLIDTIIAHEDAPYELKLIFELIRDHGADRLGVKKSIYTGLIELGAQLKWCRDGAVAEFGMHDIEEQRGGTTSFFGFVFAFSTWDISTDTLIFTIFKLFESFSSFFSPVFGSHFIYWRPHFWTSRWAS